MATETPTARLVLTATRARWHIAQPYTRYYTLCGIQSRPRNLDDPTFSDVCKRCERSYEREMS